MGRKSIYTFNEDPIDIGNLIKDGYLIFAGRFGSSIRYIIDEWKYYQEFIKQTNNQMTDLELAKELQERLGFKPKSRMDTKAND